MVAHVEVRQLLIQKCHTWLLETKYFMLLIWDNAADLLLNELNLWIDTEACVYFCHPSSTKQILITKSKHKVIFAFFPSF